MKSCGGAVPSISLLGGRAPDGAGRPALGELAEVAVVVSAWRPSSPHPCSRRWAVGERGRLPIEELVRRRSGNATPCRISKAMKAGASRW